MALRGLEVSYEAVRDWEAKLLPVMGDELRKRRHGTGRGAGISWYVDETYLKVRGRWCYLCRAIDRDGNLIHAMLNHDAACREHGELSNRLRPRRRHNKTVPASLRRSRFAMTAQIALDIMRAAYADLRPPRQRCEGWRESRQNQPLGHLSSGDGSQPEPPNFRDPSRVAAAPQASIFKAARNALCGISTLPNCRIRFLPSFCFSRSFRLRLMSPP